MPGFIPASCMTSSASPRRSRASSVENVSPTIGATGRCALGNCGSLGCARQAVSASAAAIADALFHILNLDSLAGHALGEGRGHEPVEVAVEHIAWAGRGDAGPQILHQLI